MSRTTIYAVYPNDRVEAITELGNAWLSAPEFWDALAKIYLDEKSFLFNSDRLWALQDDARLSDAQRAVLLMTFDNALVGSEHFSQAAVDIRTMMGELNVGGHWSRIADLLENEPNVPSVGFYWTSVSEDPFVPYSTEDDDGNEIEGELDWSKFWYPYSEMEEV